MNEKNNLFENSLLKKPSKAYERVYLSRDKDRPKGIDFIENLIKDPIYLHGDRYYGEDKAILCGIGEFEGQVVNFISLNKGRNTEECVEYNFGMVGPEGYRKAIRIMKQAEKFNRNLIIFIDTPGAYPGIGAEERGQASAIANSIYTMTNLNVPIVTVITGEAASGGAIALGLSDYLIMMENSIYSILSPEGFASILWKDAKRAKEAMNLMKLTSYDLLKFKIADEVVKEKEGLGREEFKENYKRLRASIKKALNKLSRVRKSDLLIKRRKRFSELRWD